MRLAKIETSYARTTEGETAAGPVALDDLGRLQPEDIFKKLYHQKWGEEVPNPMMRAFAELLHEPVGGSGL